MREVTGGSEGDGSNSRVSRSVAEAHRLQINIHTNKQSTRPQLLSDTRRRLAEDAESNLNTHPPTHPSSILQTIHPSIPLSFILQIIHSFIIHPAITSIHASLYHPSFLQPSLHPSIHSSFNQSINQSSVLSSSYSQGRKNLQPPSIYCL